MIYLNNYKVNKFGNFNRAYQNGRLIYQTYVGGMIEPDEPTTDTYIVIETNDEWELSTVPCDARYTTYQSFAHKGQDYSMDRLRIKIKGYNSFLFKYRSYAESSYDYLCIGELDKDFSNATDLIAYFTAGVKYNTRGNQSDTVWNDATYDNIDPTVEHFIDVIYRKDISGSNNEDRGYIGVVLGEFIEKWETSTTEFVTVENDDGTYTFYTKEYKYISFDDGNSWIQTATYRQGETELVQSLVSSDGYICNNGNKYSKNEIYVILNSTNIPTSIFSIGNLLEENATECQWITLTTDTARDIPMQTFRIDATDPYNSGYYFITFSATPNYEGGNASITTFSICPDEGLIWDSGSKKNIVDQVHIEGNIYEYTFSQVVYFAGGERNAPLSQVQYKPM